MSKDIKFGVEGRAAMLTGVETLADAVQVRKSELWWRRQKYCCLRRKFGNAAVNYLTLGWKLMTVGNLGAQRS